VRIIGGKLKGIRFVPAKGFPSRPTTDFAKEALFNILINKFEFGNLEVLDLFAGTGNITLEFASREAGNITAIDIDFRSIQYLKSLVKKLELDDYINVIKADSLKFIENHAKSYDIIFVDPPFEETYHLELVNKIMNSSLLKENGVLVVEHGKRDKFEEHPNYTQTRRYGGVMFSFFEHIS